MIIATIVVLAVLIYVFEWYRVSLLLRSLEADLIVERNRANDWERRYGDKIRAYREWLVEVSQTVTPLITLADMVDRSILSEDQSHVKIATYDDPVSVEMPRDYTTYRADAFKNPVVRVFPVAEYCVRVRMARLIDPPFDRLAGGLTVAALGAKAAFEAWAKYETKEVGSMSCRSRRKMFGERRSDKRERDSVMRSVNRRLKIRRLVQEGRFREARDLGWKEAKVLLD